MSVEISIGHRRHQVSTEPPDAALVVAWRVPGSPGRPRSGLDREDSETAAQMTPRRWFSSDCADCALPGRRTWTESRYAVLVTVMPVTPPAAGARSPG
jgi:hypothetical protein